MTPVTLRADFDAGELRALAKVSKSAGATRRLLALAEVYDGGSRTDAARIGAIPQRRPRHDLPLQTWPAPSSVLPAAHHSAASLMERVAF